MDDIGSGGTGDMMEMQVEHAMNKNAPHFFKSYTSISTKTDSQEKDFLRRTRTTSDEELRFNEEVLDEASFKKALLVRSKSHGDQLFLEEETMMQENAKIPIPEQQNFGEEEDESITIMKLID
jgi:hypothetical protein